MGEALLLEAGTEVVVPADADAEMSAETVEPLLGGPKPEARKPVSSGAAMVSGLISHGGSDQSLMCFIPGGPQHVHLPTAIHHHWCLFTSICNPGTW